MLKDKVLKRRFRLNPTEFGRVPFPVTSERAVLDVMQRNEVGTVKAMLLGC